MVCASLLSLVSVTLRVQFDARVAIDTRTPFCSQRGTSYETVFRPPAPRRRTHDAAIRVYVLLLAHKTSKEHLVKAAERSPIRDQAGQAGCEAGVWGVARPQVILRAVAEVEALLEEEGGHA